jgi:hypothetical protein
MSRNSYSLKIEIYTDGPILDKWDNKFDCTFMVEFYECVLHISNLWAALKLLLNTRKNSNFIYGRTRCNVEVLILFGIISDLDNTINRATLKIRLRNSGSHHATCLMKCPCCKGFAIIEFLLFFQTPYVLLYEKIKINFHDGSIQYQSTLKRRLVDTYTTLPTRN